MNPQNIKKYNWVLLAVFALFFAIDIGSDIHDGARIEHMAFEIVLFGISFGALIFFALDYFHTKSKHIQLTMNLQNSQLKLKEFSKINEAHVKGLAEAIDKVFQDWGLTPSEKEIASLLLKGLSLKKISEIRRSSERTVRTQTTTIYEKSGLAGRAELAAYFLEDLLDRSLKISSNLP